MGAGCPLQHTHALLGQWSALFPCPLPRDAGGTTDQARSDHERPVVHSQPVKENFMTNDLVDWRMRLIEAVNLLRSGAVDPYAVILDAESFGEDSPVMDACRGIFNEMGVTDDDLKLWFRKYQERITRPVPA